MFDKTFFKFALGFTAIIAMSVTVLFVSGYLNKKVEDGQKAAVLE